MRKGLQMKGQDEIIGERVFKKRRNGNLKKKKPLQHRKMNNSKMLYQVPNCL